MSFRLAREIKARLPLERELFLSVLGGLESGVATTAAIVIGLTISEKTIEAVTIAAYVTVMVQAFNAAAARYVGLRTSEEIDNQLDQGRFKPLVNSMVQFLAHFLASTVPIIPLYYATAKSTIIVGATGLAYITLLIIGLAQGKFLRVQAKQNFLEILFTGTLVMAVGSIAGLILR